jgi:diguanylate cyclase
MLIDLKDAPEKSKRIFAQILDIFEEQSISPTPLNYYVWYNYIKGDNPKFRQEMDSALNDPFGYNDRLGKRLYEAYLSNEDEADNQFDRSLKRLISSIIKKMDFWSERLSKQADELLKTQNSLSNDDLNQEQLKSLTSKVLESASSMKDATENFNDYILGTQDEIAHLREQLIEAKAQVMTDELTEVGNRKSFNNTIIELTESAKENPGSLSLIMTDIDHFKRFNDEFGHLVGDSVLRYFTSIIKKDKQKNESLSRYGGEEFAILIADSDKNSAIQRAEEIRKSIQEAKLKRKGSTKELGKITASFGVSNYRGESETIDEFINRADEALYLAKESGRNQVKSEDDLPKDTPNK